MGKDFPDFPDFRKNSPDFAKKSAALGKVGF
jgi:hypothetical protein